MEDRLYNQKRSDVPDSMPVSLHGQDVPETLPARYNHAMGEVVADCAPNVKPIFESIAWSKQHPINFSDPMGDEFRRLATFTNWPSDCPVYPRELAQAGFYYYGIQDVVRCFVCNGMLRNFEVGDTAWGEHQRHFPECPFVLQYHPRYANRSEAVLANGIANPEKRGASSYILNYLSNGVEGLEIVRGPPEVYSLPTDALKPKVPTASNPVDKSVPSHPEFSSLDSRLDTFVKWPANLIQTPDQLAEAGFYFTTKGDSVICFHCGGGLHNWTKTDEPWFEHAKWFPDCIFVLQCKGKRFVERAKASNDAQEAVAAVMKKQQTILEGIHSGLPNKEAVHLSNENALPSNYARKGNLKENAKLSQRKGKVQVEMSKPYIQAVVNMNLFSEKLVKKAVTSKIQETGSEYESAGDLFDAVEDLQDSGVTGSSSESETDFGSDKDDVQANVLPRDMPSTEKQNDDPKSLEELREENRRLKEEGICKICMDEDIEVLLLPCGHLIACANCAPLLRECPICRAAIRGTVRTYMS